MDKEKVLDIVEKAINSAFEKGIKHSIDNNTGCFETYELCKDEAIQFTNDNLKAVNSLLSDDYKTGYKEGIEHYLMRKNATKKTT